MSPRRVRTHANPLSWRGEVPPPDWTRAFADPSLPWAVDWGMGNGVFLLASAARSPDWNWIGIEVRKPLADRVAEEIRARGIPNAFAVWGNVAPGLPGYFPSRSLRRIYALFPDPWFKKKHEKRRLLAGDFLDRLSPCVAPGAEFLLSSDQPTLAQWMRAKLDARRDWENLDGKGNYAPARAIEIPTEWERHAEKAGRPIAWLRYRFSGAPLSPSPRLPPACISEFPGGRKGVR